MLKISNNKSRKRESTVLASASIILLASENLEVISPVFLVEKNPSVIQKHALYMTYLMS